MAERPLGNFDSLKFCGFWGPMPQTPSFTYFLSVVATYFQIKYKNASFKSSENIQKKGCVPDRSVSDNQSSSMTLNELAMKVRKLYCNFNFQQRSHTMADINPNEVQIL